jgi:hypothetical protein
VRCFVRSFVITILPAANALADRIVSKLPKERILSFIYIIYRNVKFLASEDNNSTGSVETMVTITRRLVSLCKL